MPPELLGSILTSNLTTKNWFHLLTIFRLSFPFEFYKFHLFHASWIESVPPSAAPLLTHYLETCCWPIQLRLCLIMYVTSTLIKKRFKEWAGYDKRCWNLIVLTTWYFWKDFPSCLQNNPSDGKTERVSYWTITLTTSLVYSTFDRYACPYSHSIWLIQCLYSASIGEIFEKRKSAFIRGISVMHNPVLSHLLLHNQ